MTSATRRRLVYVGCWGSVAMNVVAASFSIATRHYGEAGLQVAFVAGILAGTWGFDRLVAHTEFVLRELAAKAAFAELLLARLKESGGFGVEISTPVEAPGTKH